MSNKTAIDSAEITYSTVLSAAALECLNAADINQKVRLTQHYAQWFREGKFSAIHFPNHVPEAIKMPGRPDKPILVSPRELRKRGLGSLEGRAAFIHAIAHIELNAIDLAWDAVYRFTGLPAQFYSDWVGIADDESRHFILLRQRLQELGFDYGDFVAHNGLWEMCERTAHDGLTRMALVPRVLEARGLDVTPAMISKLRQLKDNTTADILEIILSEEISHVAAGSRWFRWYCEQRCIEPKQKFSELLKEYASGYLYGPFNLEARLEAGFDEQELLSLQALDGQ